jgi:hypothetical protein
MSEKPIEVVGGLTTSMRLDNTKTGVELIGVLQKLPPRELDTYKGLAGILSELDQMERNHHSRALILEEFSALVMPKTLVDRFEKVVDLLDRQGKKADKNFKVEMKSCLNALSGTEYRESLRVTQFQILSILNIIDDLSKNLVASDLPMWPECPELTGYLVHQRKVYQTLVESIVFHRICNAINGGSGSCSLKALYLAKEEKSFTRLADRTCRPRAFLNRNFSFLGKISKLFSFLNDTGYQDFLQRRFSGFGNTELAVALFSTSRFLSNEDISKVLFYTQRFTQQTKENSQEKMLNVNSRTGLTLAEILREELRIYKENKELNRKGASGNAIVFSTSIFYGLSPLIKSFYKSRASVSAATILSEENEAKRDFLFGKVANTMSYLVDHMSTRGISVTTAERYETPKANPTEFSVTIPSPRAIEITGGIWDSVYTDLPRVIMHEVGHTLLTRETINVRELLGRLDVKLHVYLNALVDGWLERHLGRMSEEFRECLSYSKEDTLLNKISGIYKRGVFSKTLISTLEGRGLIRASLLVLGSYGKSEHQSKVIKMEEVSEANIDFLLNLADRVDALYEEGSYEDFLKRLVSEQGELVGLLESRPGSTRESGEVDPQLLAKLLA